MGILMPCRPERENETGRRRRRRRRGVWREGASKTKTIPLGAALVA